jgi:hypothetical protein
MTDDIKKLPADRIRSDAATRLLIARVCGHYLYDDPAIKAARARLYANLDRFKMIEAADGTAAGFVIARVRVAIEFYLRHFALDGINAFCM